MKQTFPAERLIPIIEEKFDVKFEKIEGIVQRKSLETDQLVIDPNDERCVLAKISTIDIDRSGDIVIPEGCDLIDFEKNSVQLVNHDYSKLPIGKVVKIQITRDAVLAKIQLSTTPDAENVYKLIKDGSLKSNSIGFIALETLKKGSKEFINFVNERFNGVIDKSCKQIISKWRLLENSFVSIPANKEALIMAVKNIETTEQSLQPINNEVVKADTVVETPVEPTISEQVNHIVEDVKDVVQDVEKVVEAVVDEVKPIVERFIRLVSKPEEEVKKEIEDNLIKKRLGKIS